VPRHLFRRGRGKYYSGNFAHSAPYETAGWHGGTRFHSKHTLANTGFVPRIEKPNPARARCARSYVRDNGSAPTTGQNEMRFTLKDIQKSTARIAAPPATARGPTTDRTQRTLFSARKAHQITPHDILWAAVKERWPGLAVREYEKAVPNRRYRIDIAFPKQMVGIEVDGYRHHGRYLADFVRDRERQNLLCIHGWRVLRFTAGMIRKDLNHQIDIIAAALSPTVDMTALSTRRSFLRRVQPTRGRVMRSQR